MIRICYVFFFFMLIAFTARAQQANWQNLDLKTDNVFGISTEQAYKELLHGKRSTTVIVAILDSGTDTAHVDLKSVLWSNPKEKSNHKDDDRNGYIDDVHGWNFIGGTKGNVSYDNLELTRLIRRGDAKLHPEMQLDFDKKLHDAKRNIAGISNFKNILDTIVGAIGKPEPLSADFESYIPQGKGQEYVRKTLMQFLPSTTYTDFVEKQINNGLKHYKSQVDYELNLNFDPRSIVGDNYANSLEKNYGNRDVTGPEALHGTHVAGIVGASRQDTIGIKGVADNVRLMIVRAVPQGDERDKDVANGIRYAVDNGARIINMSFGKPYSWDKPAVDAAVKYAMSKDVLLIQAAGNETQNNDSLPHYPNRVYADGSGKAGAYIVVGASGWINDKTLVAPFSNYGVSSVDVFAPGEQILSTVPGSKYQRLDGTSMAAPVVTGLAALIREYYPKLTAVQVKDIILRSVVKVDHPVTVTRNGKAESVSFTQLCSTGGIINAYQALQLAASYSL